MNSERREKVEVISTIIRSKRDFYFANETATGIEDVEGRVVKLDWLDEMRVSDHIFGYIVFVRPGIKHADGSVDVGRLAAYRCFDLKGDGVFELLQTDMAIPPKVPEWASDFSQ